MYNSCTTCTQTHTQMDVYSSGQIIRYIASQGPMQHTTKDMWQVSGCGQACGILIFSLMYIYMYACYLRYVFQTLCA